MTLICTHGLFLGGALERIAAIPQIKEIITTDTVHRTKEDTPGNMHIISVAEPFAEAIRCNYLHQSIGPLFDI